MAYSKGHPIRLIGGRLALDFVNTADWSCDGQILRESIVTETDLKAWMDALDIGASTSGLRISELLSYRMKLRQLLTTSGDPLALNALKDIDIAADCSPERAGANQSLRALLAVSALSILMDGRERRRVKMCPGDDCGWLFIDETKNGRRTWCSMKTCGNRAKAARHYARSKDSSAQLPRA